MKQHLYRSAGTLLAATLLLAGCSRDRFHFPDQPVTDVRPGYIALTELAVGVSADLETLSSGSGANTAPATRATAEADGTYRISVTNSATQERIWEGTYADLKGLGAPIEAAPGRYTVQAASESEPAAVAWETPAYAGQTECTVVSEETTTVSDLVCTLSNIKTTVELSADLKELFRTDGDNPLQTVVSLGEASSLFVRDETRAAYFAAPEASNTLTVKLTGDYNTRGEGEEPQYKPVTMTQTIPDVKAGQWRRIVVAVGHADEGNVQIVVTVETWTYDEQIDVDVMSMYAAGEEEIPDYGEETSDPDGPQTSLDGGHDIALPFRIGEELFDFDFDPVRCNELLGIVSAPRDGATVTEAYCRIESENADLLAALAAAGYEEGTVPLYPALGPTQYAIARTDAEGGLVVKVNDAGMYALYGYEGSHTLRIVVTDSENRRSVTPLTVVVERGTTPASGPAIEGLDGFNLDMRHTISPTSPIPAALSVRSQTGITEFGIEILGGEVLPDNELTGIGLAPKMDLLHPATEEMAAMLREFGFLPSDGSSLEGAREVRFDITDFIPAMTALGGTGDCDFRITVGDASGTTVKTLMFTVVH